MPSDSKAIEDLKLNLDITKSFLGLIEKLNSLPDMKRARFTETRSLFQAVSKGRELAAMEKELEVARPIQDTLVPPNDPVDCGFFQFAGYFQPATQCGGDWSMSNFSKTLFLSLSFILTILTY